MDTEKTCNWIGKSGKSYRYYIWSLPQSFSPNQDGNYIFAKLVNNLWVPIYIGQGDLGSRIGPYHHKYNCIYSKGVTHVHVHLNTSRESREAEESDLLAYYTNAFYPHGCNEKI